MGCRREHASQVGRLVWAGLLLVLAACGGGGADSVVPNRAPVPGFQMPDAGTLFSAGQALTVSVAAADPEDGVLAPSRLVWWVLLHHDNHTHPQQPETVGSGGSVTIPTRGETSDNIFYRFYLRATDSAGRSTEITRDVMPRKARVTLLTQPAGLALTLDGQPVTGGHVFTGVVGIERDLAAAEQIVNGRRYRFASWSDGGAAAHTLSTPVADTTLTATFLDLGAVNNLPPSVSLEAPAQATQGVAVQLLAAASDSDGSVVRVEFFEGSVLIGEDTGAPFGFNWIPTLTGSRSLSARATDDQGAATTSAAVLVQVSAPTADNLPPTVSITAPGAFAAGLNGSFVFSANASDNVAVALVEFQLDGVPLGAPVTVPPFSVNVDSTAHASGQHVLRVRAADAAGNLSAWARRVVQFGGNRNQPAGVDRNEAWVTGLSSATAFAQAPDGRLLVAQQGGALRVVKNGALLPTAFLTLPVDQSGERGLLGVALHPNYVSNGFVYLYHTTTDGVIHNRISRFTASAANPDLVQPGSELRLVDLPALSNATNHNGGALHFGIDGKLYVGVGDNASPARAPDLGDPLGKLLRFNDDGSIPTDNPHYATQTGLARAIWARGLRNPFTFAVQPGSGRIHINDVGQNTWEEVNVGAPGADYGWPASEGPDNVSGNRTGPLWAYRHSAAAPPGSGPGGFFVGFAIAGGAFYPANGPLGAPWRGNYFFADYVSKFIGALDLSNDNAAYAFGNVSGNPVDLLAAADGALLVLTRNGIVRFSVP